MCLILVLSRKIGETIVIDDQIQVTVVSMQGNKVRLGVIAPKECCVHRLEVYEKIQKEREGR